MPVKEKHHEAVRSITANSKKVREPHHLNEVAFNNIIFPGNDKSITGKIACSLIKVTRQKSIPKATVIWLGWF